MRKLLVELAYNGAGFHGWQFQKNACSVAQTVQDGLEAVLKSRVPVTGCSRTDAGVHANQFYFHTVTQATIPCEKLVYALNAALPDAIAAKSCREVEESFHARYSVQWKRYLYRIHNHPVKDPFAQGLCLRYPRRLDEQLLNQAAQDFVGTHDFSAFCAAGGKEMESNVRTIYSASVTRKGDQVYFAVEGNGFLYNMVRIMVGTLLEISEKTIAPDSIPEIIASLDRSRAGRTAPAQGLYLDHVEYGGELPGETEKNK